MRSCIVNFFENNIEKPVISEKVDFKDKHQYYNFIEYFLKFQSDKIESVDFVNWEEQLTEINFKLRCLNE